MCGVLGQLMWANPDPERSGRLLFTMQAGIGTRLWRGWHKLGPAERWVFGSYIAAVLLHMLWRWAWPRCYSRWRHLTATVLTLVATTLPAFWRRRIQVRLWVCACLWVPCS